MCLRLEEWQHIGMQFDDLRQEIGIADFRQPRAFLFARKTGEVIRLIGIDLRDVAAGDFRERRLCREIPARACPHSRDQSILSESFAIEENTGPQFERIVQPLIVSLVKFLRVDTKFGQQSLGDGAVAGRAFDGLSAAVAEQHPVPGFELVALGVPAKIVVVVENQDACPASGSLAIEVRCCQSADAPADHHQVVALAGFFRTGGAVPRFAVAQTDARK